MDKTTRGRLCARLRRAKEELVGEFVRRRAGGVERFSMTSPEIRIHYLADHSELVGDLARISWGEWRSIYEQRGETLRDALRKFQERVNIDRLPLTLVALADRSLPGPSR